MQRKSLIMVRGAGDLASAVLHRLHRCGYRQIALECEKPTAIRREVSFCEAVYEGEAFVEGVLSRRIEDVSQCSRVWEDGEIPVIVDETMDTVQQLRPDVFIDATLAKKNIGGVNPNLASLTIALGPGFCAGDDVDIVIETMRGHDLGRIIEQGWALPNTGIPGRVAGAGRERVIHAPASGMIRSLNKISDIVEQGQVIARIGDTEVLASITGVLRGMIRDGYQVEKGMKIADIDPRKSEKKNCFTISDKARCIAGSVLEVLLWKGFL